MPNKRKEKPSTSVPLRQFPAPIPSLAHMPSPAHIPSPMPKEDLFMSEVQLCKFADYFMTPLLKTIQRANASLVINKQLEEFTSELRNRLLVDKMDLSNEYIVAMLLQMCHKLFQLQQCDIPCNMLSISDVSIKGKKSAHSATPSKHIINVSMLENIYCFVLTRGVRTEYSESAVKDFASLDDPDIALDLVEKMAAHKIFTIKEVLNHPFHWTNGDKISFICQAYDFIDSKCKCKEKDENDKKDENGKEISKKQLTLKHYQIEEGRDAVIDSGGWLVKLKLDQNATKELKDKNGRSVRPVRIVDNDIIYDKRFNNPSLLTEEQKKIKKPSYDSESLFELLRFFRNRYTHYWEDNNKVRFVFGSQNSGYWKFYSKRYPNLFMHVYHKMRHCLRSNDPEYVTPMRYLPKVQSNYRCGGST